MNTPAFKPPVMEACSTLDGAVVYNSKGMPSIPDDTWTHEKIGDEMTSSVLSIKVRP